ncbi:terminase [Clostridium sp.]|uniref:XkdQ/YqbQ family protein n=1 Tax=Clostridium sp. TaxID=1506 RepID=UPI00284C8B67|nr:terminase [Clostridium sp.]MDR3595096.1 terminase [Clostridium sp.]
MIKLYSLYDGWLLTEITPLVKQVQWSGSITQPARKVTFNMVYPITDDNQPKVQIGPGTLISIVDSDTKKEIFRGQVIDRTLDSTNQEESFTVVDYLRFFMQSKDSKNIKNELPENIASKVCENFSDMGIQAGSMESTGISINRKCSKLSHYNIIMECYTQAAKQNGLRYIPIMDADKLNVILKGTTVSNFTLQSLKDDPYNNNLIGMTYKDSIDKMVNKIKIVDSDDNYIDTVENTGLISSYGLLQDIYQKEKDKDPYTVANNMLYGFDHEISVETAGNIYCITGYAIPTKIWYLDVLYDTTLYIDEDTHTWDCGTGKYTMKLTLNFNNIMDFQGVDS